MKFKKLVCFILCAIMSFSLLACTKSPTGGDGPKVDPTTKYTITFDVGKDARDEGISNPASQQVISGGTLEFSTIKPNDRAEYRFGGWFNGGTQYTDSTVIKSNVTVTARWISKEEDAYESTLESWSQPGHLYIHYKRYSHNKSEEDKKTNTGAPDYTSAIDSPVYSDWGLWIWPKNDEGRLFNASKIDISGAVYDILLDHTYNDGGWDSDPDKLTDKGLPINYAVSQGKPVTEVGMQLFSITSRLEDGFWANDGGNNYLTLENIKRDNGSYHWFVIEGSVTKGSKTFVNVEIVDPYADDPDRTLHASKGNIDSLKDNSKDYPVTAVKGWDGDGVGYQIFVASFCDSDNDGMGDIPGITSQLDYLEKLNVDVLWLTPFQTSTNYHGYDIKDWYSVDSRFGTLADYRKLVYEAHRRGMKIVMDFVLNHTASANPWFVKSQNLVTEEVNGKEINYRNFYNWITKAEYDKLSKEAKSQWYKDNYGYYFYSSFSSDQPELNYDYQPVRDAILDVAEYWMSFGLDGFRLDAVKHIYMKNENPGKTGGTLVDADDAYYCYNQTRDLNFYREFNYRLKKSYPTAFVVGENFDGDPKNVEPFYCGIDSQFDFNTYYDAARVLTAAGNSALNAYGSLIKVHVKGRDGEGSRTQGYKSFNPDYIGGQFTSNHDMPRARDKVNATPTGNLTGDKYRGFYKNGTKIAGTAAELDKAAVSRSEDLLRLYYAYLMTIPGITWIYYGDEIGMTGLMQYTVTNQSTSSTDSASHEDRIYRQPMKWKNVVADNSHYRIGFEDYECKLEGLNATDYVKGVDAQNEDKTSLLNWMRTLTKVRHEHPELINGEVQGTLASLGNTTVGYCEYVVKAGSKSTKVCISTNGSAGYSTSGKYASWKSTDGKLWVTIGPAA